MKFIRKNYEKIYPLLVLVIYAGCYTAGFFDFVNIDLSIALTLAVAIAGFLFTSLSIILASSDKDFMKFLREYGAITQVERVIAIGMVASMVSVVAYLFRMISGLNLERLNFIIYLGLVEGVICFIVSSLKLLSLLQIVADYDAGKYKYKR